MEPSLDTVEPGFNRQQNAWRLLKGLHPRPIDLGRVALIREQSRECLANKDTLSELIPRLGLNDEGLDEFPAPLRDHCGRGLLIWQYPVQFGPYLAVLARLGVRSYLELGIRHGGSYVATVEVLDRFRPLDFAVGVDIIPCPAMANYEALNPRSRFVCLNSQSVEFAALVESLAPVDLVFIDSHHDESQCRNEFTLLSPHAHMIALHDIANAGCPGIAVVWQEIRALSDWTCLEFAAQYPGLRPAMGIGLAIKNNRLPEGVSLERVSE
jgi:hypothetical protein